MSNVILSPLRTKNLVSDGQMLHFVQHDNPSNELLPISNECGNCGRALAVEVGLRF